MTWFRALPRWPSADTWRRAPPVVVIASAVGHDATVNEAAAGIPEQVRRVAVSAARRTATAMWALSVLLGVVGLVVLFVVPSRPGFFIAAPPLTLGALAGFVAYRHGSARRLIEGARGVPVRFERWTRVPDGCNVAVFSCTSESEKPIAVVRLPTKKAPRAGEGWYFERVHATAAAVVDTSGELIGAGSIPPDGRSAWNRRNEASPDYRGGTHLVQELIRARRRGKSDSEGSASQN